ncbi:hypothetical protein FRX31_031033 [Thalictrum thalictroides]|uniref:Uncharacterized protein n=1 Tax=Thalictrum thalictroides TaxID=46969 RepID=A0A7J6V568_THATH|nr:hypothetical protein FRX31_031033 [Thalictrum thalictroides]
MTAKVSCLVENSVIVFPDQLKARIQDAGLATDNVLKIGDDEEDSLLWCPDSSGEFSVKSAFNEIRNQGNEARWCKLLWKPHIHPKTAAKAWKLIKNRVASEKRSQSIGVSLASACRLCMTGEDSVEHVCWHCPMAQRMWSWARRKFRHNREFWSLGQAICRPKEWSPLIQNLWSTTVFSGMVAIWQLRNSVVMGNERIRIEKCQSFIKNQIDIAARMSKANSYRNALEEDILLNWNLRTNHTSRVIKECRWLPPAANVIKANTDGASTDSNSGLGVVFRDCDCNIILTVCKNIGDMNSFQAEYQAIISALEVAVSRGWDKVWIESDSQAAITSFAHNRVPWQMKFRWLKVVKFFTMLQMSTTWREANFSADKASKVALSLTPHILYSYEERPTWLTVCENPDTSYYRFK